MTAIEVACEASIEADWHSLVVRKLVAEGGMGIELIVAEVEVNNGMLVDAADVDIEVVMTFCDRGDLRNLRKRFGIGNF